jgi:hypothetical protein
MNTIIEHDWRSGKAIATGFHSGNGQVQIENTR